MTIQLCSFGTEIYFYIMSWKKFLLPWLWHRSSSLSPQITSTKKREEGQLPWRAGTKNEKTMSFSHSKSLVTSKSINDYTIWYQPEVTNHSHNYFRATRAVYVRHCTKARTISSQTTSCDKFHSWKWSCSQLLYRLCIVQPLLSHKSSIWDYSESCS